MKVAFLGLGIMGRPMASNLVKAGHQVSVWNRTSGKDVEGARTAPSPADAARDAEVIWLCLADTKAVEIVLFGPRGTANALSKATTWSAVIFMLTSIILSVMAARHTGSAGSVLNGTKSAPVQQAPKK